MARDAALWRERLSRASSFRGFQATLPGVHGGRLAFSSEHAHLWAVNSYETRPEPGLDNVVCAMLRLLLNMPLGDYWR
jgi:hypothetical protein